MSRNRMGWIAAGLVAALGLFAIGCIPEDAKRAEEQVRAAKDVKALTKDEVNRLFLLKKEDPSKVPYGRVYEVTGKVEKVAIQDNSEMPPEDEKRDDTQFAIVTIYLPDYAGGSIDLHFDIAHKDELRALKKGDTLKVRGKLSEMFHLFDGDKIDLNGCFIQK